MSVTLPFKVRGLVAALAGPLLHHGDVSRADLERGAKQADGQVHPAAAEAEAEDQMCGRAVAVAQLRQLVAEPPMRWVGNGWQCSDSETRVTLDYAGGERRDLVVAPSSRLSLAAGFLLFPADTNEVI